MLVSYHIEELETILDSAPLSEVLDTIRLLCYEKANAYHQDRIRARTWEKSGRVLSKAQAHIERIEEQ